jgi:hypothetical protein
MDRLLSQDSQARLNHLLDRSEVAEIAFARGQSGPKGGSGAACMGRPVQEQQVNPGAGGQLTRQFPDRLIVNKRGQITSDLVEFV